jgi:hypothetical protein
MKDVMEKMFKEMAMAYFKALFKHSLGRTKTDH